VEKLYFNKYPLNRIQYLNQDYLFHYASSEMTGTHLLWLIPYQTLTQKTYSVIIYVVVIAILLILVSSFIGVLISSSISKPIMNLEKMTKEISRGNFENGCVIKSKNEIGQLYRSFNKMKNRISDLLLKEKKSRTEFLASQINPHFLYNSLDSAYMSAIANDDMDTSDIIGHINILLKMVAREPGFITLQKELEILNAYVEIQKMRYPHKFDFVVEVEESIEKVIVPKMILQPIVENAITHGILELDERGIIIISARMEGSNLNISIKNGPGQKSEVELEAINDYIINHNVYDAKHIGLQNIYERLSLNYQDGVKLYICNSQQINGVEVNLSMDISSKGDAV